MAGELQGEEIPPLILKKKIKLPAGAHGGAWKVAYADFVTAMMAFFLLLWLLSAATEDQMTGLSDYFSPPAASSDTRGIGEALQGLDALITEGGLRSPSSPPSTSIPLPAYGAEVAGQEDGEERDDINELNVSESDTASGQDEDLMLDEAMQQLMQSIFEDPQLRDLQDSIVAELTADGLEIQLLDYQRREMFEPGTNQMTRRAQQLLALISAVSLELPNQISITGHTDSAAQPGSTPTYGNWELSSDRAAISREWMVRQGFPDDRIIRVEGRADTDLLDRQNPENERNRRISITLLRDQPVSRPTQGGAAGANGSGTNTGGGAGSTSGGPPALPGNAASDGSGLAPPPLPDQ